MSGEAKVPGPPVALSTSSVYPERTPDAFEMAARLGYDGIEVMVYTDPVSQDADVLRRLSDYHQVPILSVHAPSLLLTQRVWGREPWEKLRRAAELADRVGARVVVLHPPFRWQREYVRGFEKGLAAMAEETDVVFAVENMYPLGPAAAKWCPTPRTGTRPHSTSRTSRWTSRTPRPRVPTPWSWRPNWAAGSPTCTWPTAQEIPPGRCRTSTWCPAAVASPRRAPGLLSSTGYHGVVVVEVKTNRAPTREDRVADLAESLAFARKHLALAAG